MAQVPWQIVSRGPLEAPEALRQLRACYRSVRAAAAAAAGEGGAAASALLQHEDLGHLKAAHAALRKLLQVEAADTQAATASSCNTCFEQVRVRGTAILPPSFWQVARLGVYRHLLGFLFKFVPELDGVWLAFTETRPATVSSSRSGSKSGSSSSRGALGYLLPDLDSNDGTVFVSVETTALVFRPKVGDLITCEAQTVRPAVLRLLWLGHFTAIISREHLGDRFEYLEEAKVYVHRKDKTRRIAEKVFVRMHVIEVPKSHNGDRVAIRGSLLARGSGPLVVAQSVEAEGVAKTDDAQTVLGCGVTDVADNTAVQRLSKRKVHQHDADAAERASVLKKREKACAAAAAAAQVKSPRKENGTKGVATAHT